MTASELRKSIGGWRRAQDKADALVADRDAAILKALAGGMTQRAVAEVTGLTHGRIGQIAASAALELSSRR